jgi:hypothetical protein
MEGEGESNTLRVLVATDCHFGYMKKDEIRRFGSFQAFEEGFLSKGYLCFIQSKHSSRLQTRHETAHDH